MPAHLLDVNVLIALAWPNHVHHKPAREWFEGVQSEGWATCPITQCGFVRISSNPQIIREAVSPQDATDLLRRMTEHPRHVFWPDDLPFVDPRVPHARLLGKRQVIDAYLLALAIHRGGRLATLDRGLSALASEPHRRDALVLISA